MSVKSSQLEPSPSLAIKTATTSNKKDVGADEVGAVPSTPKRRRDTSPDSLSSSTSPNTPDSVTQELASRRVGERSLTPYPPPPFSPRITVGRRSLTPYPSRRRQSGSTSPSTKLSSSPDKENEPFVRSAVPSPSPKKKSKRESKGRGTPLSRSSSESSVASSDFSFTFRIPVNSPASVASSRSDRAPPTTSVDASELERRLAQVDKKCKELTELPLADVTEAFKETAGKDVFDGLDFSDILAPLDAPRN